MAAKELTHWGHAILLEDDWECNLGSLGAYVHEIRVTIGAETGRLYQVSWGAGNETYSKILTGHDWGRTIGNPDLNFETKGDLVEWVLSCASIGPLYPGLFAGWGMGHNLRG